MRAGPVAGLVMEAGKHGAGSMVEFWMGLGWAWDGLGMGLGWGGS